jgi:hypothetical protein
LIYKRGRKTMSNHFGEYGGLVIRTFSGDGKKWIAGAILKPEDVMGWPEANRRALKADGKVDWYGPPVAEEQKAREAGSPAPKRGAVGVVAKAKADKPKAEAKTPTAHRARQ